MGGLQKGDERSGGRSVLPHRASHVFRDGAAVVPRGAGVEAYETAPGPAQSPRAHILREQTLPRRRSQQDQAGASVQVQGELRRSENADSQVTLLF